MVIIYNSSLMNVMPMVTEISVNGNSMNAYKKLKMIGDKKTVLLTANLSVQIHSKTPNVDVNTVGIVMTLKLSL